MEGVSGDVPGAVSCRAGGEGAKYGGVLSGRLPDLFDAWGGHDADLPLKAALGTLRVLHQLGLAGRQACSGKVADA